MSLRLMRRFDVSAVGATVDYTPEVYGAQFCTVQGLADTAGEMLWYAGTVATPTAQTLLNLFSDQGPDWEPYTYGFPCDVENLRLVYTGGSTRKFRVSFYEGMMAPFGNVKLHQGSSSLSAGTSSTMISNRHVGSVVKSCQMQLKTDKAGHITVETAGRGSTLSGYTAVTNAGATGGVAFSSALPAGGKMGAIIYNDDGGASNNYVYVLWGTLG